MATFSKSLWRALREGAKDDALRRKQANEVWDRIVKFVKVSLKAGDFEARTSPHMATGGFVLPFKVAKDPAVILAPKGAQTGYGRARDGRPVIVVGDVLLKPFDLTYLDARVEGLRGAFVHEYTHFQDRRRYKVPGVRMGAARAAATAGRVADYFRTPEEFNAWYQETAHLAQSSVESTLRIAQGNPAIGAHLVEIERRHFTTFPAFMTWLGKLGRTQEALDALKGTKWERKWLRRSHGLYEMLKGMLMAARTEGVFTPDQRRALHEVAYHGTKSKADLTLVDQAVLRHVGVGATVATLMHDLKNAEGLVVSKAQVQSSARRLVKAGKLWMDDSYVPPRYRPVRQTFQEAAPRGGSVLSKWRGDWVMGDIEESRATYHGRDGKFTRSHSAHTVTREGSRFKMVRQLRRMGAKPAPESPPEDVGGDIATEEEVGAARSLRSFLAASPGWIPLHSVTEAVFGVQWRDVPVVEGKPESPINRIFVETYEPAKPESDEGDTIAAARRIVARHQADKIGGVMIDAWTASMIVGVYDGLNDQNKKKFRSMPIRKMADMAMKLYASLRSRM